jgi:hypothetical protein
MKDRKEILNDLKRLIRDNGRSNLIAKKEVQQIIDEAEEKNEK